MRKSKLMKVNRPEYCDLLTPLLSQDWQ